MSDSEWQQRIEKKLDMLIAAHGAGASAAASALGVKTGGGTGGRGGAPGVVASETELNGQYGDPEIRKDPPRWEGASGVGQHFSEAAPEYLDCLADFKEWQAGKDEESGAKDSKGRPYAPLKWKDARLARGWASRIRSGWKPKGAGGGGGAAAPPPPNEDFGDFGGGSDEDIPFALNATIHGRWDRP